MKKVLFLVVFLLIFFSFAVQSYSEQDLWLLELIVNEDMSSRQVLDALIIDERVYLPLVPVANKLEISLKIDPEMGTYIFEQPGSGEEIIIDKNSLEITMNKDKIDECGIIHLICDRLFVEIDCLKELMDARFNYDAASLTIQADYKHFKKVVEEIGVKKEEVVDEKEKIKETITPFAVSNITYNLNGNWNREKSNLIIDQDSTQEEVVTEDWGMGLNLEARGTIYDWKYNLGVNTSTGKDEEADLSLGRAVLTYDMDRATFQVGKLNVYSEREVQLNNSNFYGASLISSKSPLMMHNSNMIQISGDAAAGSRVTLYINGWETREKVVGDEGKYLFRDVLLYYFERANEVKVVIEKPGGKIEEIYRYISVADSLLDKDEVNYLAQVGKLYNQDQDEDNENEADEGYIYNTIVNYGVTEKSTLGLSSYGEIISSDSWYNYNSFRLNQSLSDMFTFKGQLYNKNNLENDTAETSMGYKGNIDYKSNVTHAGVEYHREAEELNMEKEQRMEPDDIIKFYYLRDITPDSIINGRYSRYSEIANSENLEDRYEIGYLIEKDIWRGSLEYDKTINKGETETESDYWSGHISYLIKPNVELINELGYEVLWDEVFSKNLNYGVEGRINSGENTYIVGVSWTKDITENEDYTDYRLSWSKRWPLADDKYIFTKLGYEYSTEDESSSIPVGIRYSHSLTNDARVNLQYQGTWNKNNINEEEVVHEIGFSISGAFNLFGGKIVSTSPYAFGSKVGLVTGVVFNDKNRNGQLDAGEDYLPNIPVRLDRKVAFTDKDGNFIFKDVAVGRHKLSVDYNQLPIEYTPTIQEKNIIVKANGTAEENIGIYVIGVVDGRLKAVNFEQELSLSGIKLIAEPGGFSTYTDYSGYYYFDQLPTGRYIIKIDQNSLPGWASLKEKQEYEALITEKGEYISGIDFDIYITDEYSEKMTEKEGTTVKVEKIDVVEESFPQGKSLENTLRNTLKIDLEKHEAYFNGEEVLLEPFIFRDENLWTPIRAIAEIFEAEVFWNEKKKEIYIIDEDNNLLFNIPLGYAMKNGEKYGLQGIQLKDGYTFVTTEDLSLIGLNYVFEEDILSLKEK